MSAEAKKTPSRRRSGKQPPFMNLHRNLVRLGGPSPNANSLRQLMSGKQSLTPQEYAEAERLAMRVLDRAQGTAAFNRMRQAWGRFQNVYQRANGLAVPRMPRMPPPPRPATLTNLPEEAVRVVASKLGGANATRLAATTKWTRGAVRNVARARVDRNVADFVDKSLEAFGSLATVRHQIQAGAVRLAGGAVLNFYAAARVDVPVVPGWRVQLRHEPREKADAILFMPDAADAGWWVAGVTVAGTGQAAVVAPVFRAQHLARVPALHRAFVEQLPGLAKVVVEMRLQGL
jgi:hypothetical protein